MDNTNYTIYEIDAADIWRYECDCYWQREQQGTDKDSINELYDFLQQFYLQAKHEPFIKSLDDSLWAERYREKYRETLNGAVCLNFFMCGDQGYSMQYPCEVFLKKHNHLEFQRLFILKLRQYHGGLLYVVNFLKYQLETNFNNKPE